MKQTRAFGHLLNIALVPCMCGGHGAVLSFSLLSISRCLLPFELCVIGNGNYSKFQFWDNIDVFVIDLILFLVKMHFILLVHVFDISIMANYIYTLYLIN